MRGKLNKQKRTKINKTLKLNTVLYNKKKYSKNKNKTLKLNK
jgi:hypothetical protein